MSKVYLVTSGAYSDYGVRAVFSTPEAAAEYCQHQNTRGGMTLDRWDRVDGFRVEEYDMDRPRDEWPGAYRILLQADGSSRNGAYWSEEGNPRQPPRFFPNDGVFEGYGLTPEHARRSAEELRRQTLALEGKVVPAKNA